MANNEVLAKSLKTDMSKPSVPAGQPDLSKVKSSADFIPIMQDVGSKQVEADMNLKKAELGQKTALAEEQYKASQGIADTAKQRVTESQDKEKQFPYPEFHPTKDNAESLGALFSLVSTVGVMLGGSGKMSSMNALGAMNGMLKGWKEGRADLFKREKEEFDKQFNSIKTIHEDIRKSLQDYMAVLPYDKEAAQEKATMLAAKVGTDSIMGAMLQKGQLDNLAKMVDSSEKIITHLEDKKRESADKASQRALTLEVAKMKANNGNAAMPKSEKVITEHRARFEIGKTVDEVLTALNDPKYSKLITPATKFTPEFLQNLKNDYPELRTKLAKIEATEFQIGGKALTASEQAKLEPIYGWKGLTASALRDRLEENKRSLGLTQGLVEEAYPGLKAIAPRYQQIYESQGSLKDVPEIQSSEPTTYNLGDIIEHGGKKYRVTGTYQDDPSNPEVEEIK